MAKISDITSFRLSDAIKFRDTLNPQLWDSDKNLDPDVLEKLRIIAEDFITELGLTDLEVYDIRVSGSNAAYTYTDHSDLDLHILVDFDELKNDEVYQELFNAKKTIYNDSHDIDINGIPVELYVQNSQEPVKSAGEYSITDAKWIRIPKKIKAEIDQRATSAKYEFLNSVIDHALESDDIDTINRNLKKISRYRTSGLSKGGELSPENLAWKALRATGRIKALYNARDRLHSADLSLATQNPDTLSEELQVEWNNYCDPITEIAYSSGVQNLP